MNQVEILGKIFEFVTTFLGEENPKVHVNVDANVDIKAKKIDLHFRAQLQEGDK